MAKFKIDMLFWKRRTYAFIWIWTVGHPWKLFKVWTNLQKKNCRPFLKTSQIMPKCTFIFVCIYTVLYCFHWEHQHVEGVQSAHGGSLRCEGIGQIQNWYVILKEENLGFHLYINFSAILKNFSNYAQVYIHICLYLHCIVLFPLRAPASWWSAKCTRRLFKVRRNWPNSKLICYSERGEPRLSFEYTFVGHS